MQSAKPPSSLLAATSYIKFEAAEYIMQRLYNM